MTSGSRQDNAHDDRRQQQQGQDLLQERAWRPQQEVEDHYYDGNDEQQKGILVEELGHNGAIQGLAFQEDLWGK